VVATDHWHDSFKVGGSVTIAVPCRTPIVAEESERYCSSIRFKRHIHPLRRSRHWLSTVLITITQL